ncbi:MAG TPA: efflux RND transporter periplasmic adaptor subunit [Longimicrobiaceae bacterium]|nr:efflux RND transporter periplasmic adaptor subunit [Longimicrobiaceae bacterium]
MARKRRKGLIIGGILVVVAGLVGLSLAGGGEDGVEVRTEPVARRDLVSIVTASGKIEPRRKVDISADISGRVITLAVEEGQWVKAGDLLLRIDPSSYEAAVRQAQAAVAQAQARASQARANLLAAQSALQRAEFLSRGEQLISGQELDDARTRVQVAQAEHESARFAIQQAQAQLSESRDQLSKTTIRSPMAGRVTRLNIEEGETAVIGTMNNPGSLLLTISDLSVMEAKVKVDETDVPRISPGDSAVIKIDAFTGQSFTGRVTRIANSALQNAAQAAGSSDQQSVDYEVVVTLDAPPADLRPDLSATAEIVTDRRQGALAVPIIALSVRDSAGKKFRAPGEEDKDKGQPAAAAEQARRRGSEAEVQGVFVVREGKAEWVPVETGITGDEYFEIVRGLRGGEVVVSGSFQAVRELEDGDAVRVQGAEEEGEKGRTRARRAP